MGDKRIEDVAKAIGDEIDAMSLEFDCLRESGELARMIEDNEWTEFEIATPLPGKINYTLAPRDLYDRLARASLRVIAPCPACRGTGYGEIKADFLNDDPLTMKVGTCSACSLCTGSGVNPNFRVVAENNEKS